MAVSTEPMEPSFDHEAWRNLWRYIDVEVGSYTFLTLFDAAIETRLEERRIWSLSLVDGAVRDCVVGNVSEKVRAKGQTIYEPVGRRLWRRLAAHRECQRVDRVVADNEP